MAHSGVTTDQWLEAASYRRTCYALKGTSKVSDKRVEEIVEKVLSFAPSSYNIQPVRVVIATGDKHKELWDIVMKEAEPILKNAGEGVWDAMKGRFEGFKAAYGSVMFWDRGQTVKEASEKHKSSAHMFGEWSEHATGIHQILVWTALELEGLGANLQHMNAIPPAEVALKKWAGVPDDYKLKAHLNFGDEAAEHPKKPEKLPFSETIKVLK